jgi:hypothetical protein
VRFVAIVGDGGTTEYTEAEAVTQFGADFEDNVVWTNPAFVSAEEGDRSTDPSLDTFLAIPTTSAAVDVGADLDGYGTTTPDLGAYEAGEGEVSDPVGIPLYNLVALI